MARWNRILYVWSPSVEGALSIRLKLPLLNLVSGVIDAERAYEGLQK